MSIALDTALFLRENNIDLSLSDRGVLLTLMFRVGSNPFTWISQEELMKELLCSERTLRRHLKKLVELELILIEKSTKNKRFNYYRPAEFLINYHQKNRLISKDNDAKNRTNMTDENQSTGQIWPMHIGQIRPVSNCKNEAQNIDNNKEISNKKSPKGNIQIKYKSKDIIPLPPFEEKIEVPDWIEKEDWNDFLLNRKKMKSPMSLNAQTRAINQLKKLKDEGNDVKEVINQSIINNWKGLFPIKQGNSYEYRNLSYDERLKKAGDRLKKIYHSRGMDTENIHEIESNIPF